MSSYSRLTVLAPVRQSNMVKRETAIPVLPGMLGGLKRWLLAHGCAMWGGRSLPEGRGPSVAAELARKPMISVCPWGGCAFPSSMGARALI